MVAVVALSVIGVVGYTMRPRETRLAPPVVERLDPKAMVETRGGDVIQLKGTHEDLRVEFQGQVTYEDGKTKLLGVKIMVDNRGGRNYAISGKEAHVGDKQSSFDVTGDVVLETNDGLKAYSQHATYTETEKIVRAPGPVRFTSGRMTGTGVGFTYDEQRNTLWLLDQAAVHFARQGDQGEMDITSGGFGFARTDRYMRFERTMHLVREGQVIDANDATAHLFPDRDEPDLVELRGDARITGGTGMGALRLLSARDINLDYRDDGRSLQRATLAGQAAIQLASQDGSTGQGLSGESMDITLAEDGSVSGLASRDNVQVTLPATGDTSARTIRATSLTAAGAATGLSRMTFEEGVTYAEAAAKDHGVRTARSRTLDAQLTPTSGALQEARFTGGFSFEDGAMRASSAEAVYRVVAGELALVGPQRGKPPNLTDPSLTIDADTIDVTLSPRKMVAHGSVRSVLQPTQKAAPGVTAARRPALLGDADPVNVVADTLTYDEQARKGVYSGRSRLFQGDTVIQADSLTLDETRGDLTASGKVLTTLVILNKSAAEGAKTQPTIVRAGTFTYADQTRKATYETGAQMNGEQGDLRADLLSLILAPQENSLERLEASGAVNAHVDKRVVTGTRLTFQPADDKYVVQGAPVRMLDADCQETTGKTLTFFKASDRVLVDGNEEIRTQTKGGGKCPQPPSN